MIPPPEYFAHMYQYVKWADLRQLEVARTLSDEEYFKPRGWSFGSIHKVLLHQLSAQSVWLDRFLKQPAIWLQDDPRMAGRDAIEPHFLSVHQRFTAYLTTLAPHALAANLDYRNNRGEEMSIPLWRLLVHATNHSTYHRGQLNSMFSLAGAKPVTTDYQIYALQFPL